MSRRLFTPLALVVAIAALCGARADAQTTFYEAYENGLVHEKAGSWQAARDSFLKASTLRPEPARRVKSYGLNFIDSYDPPLHIARAALRLGLLDEAVHHLAISRTAAVSPAGEIAALAAEVDAGRARAVATSPPPETAAALPAPRSERTAATVPTVSATVAGTPSPTPETVVRSAPAPVLPAATRSTAAAHTPSSRPSVESLATPSTRTLGPAPAGTASPTPAPVPSAIVAITRRPEPPPGPVESPLPRGAVAAVALAAAVLIALFVWRARRRAGLMDSPHPAPVGGSSPTPAVDVGTANTLIESRPLRPGADPRFGAYVLEGILGRGGMGTTYIARRTRDGFSVALKVPHEFILEQPDFVERFLREGALGAMLHHPNIVRIYEAGEHAGHPFIAMELLGGETLEQILRTQGALPVSRALLIARGIALALDYAHLKGIVHRDLKPENVMILPDGQVKVMDYGIARRMDLVGLTGTDTYLGTPSYSAPETLTPTEVGPHSDLYSLGIILYRMLSGVLPFSAPTPFELLHKHANEPLPMFSPDLHVPPEVYGLVFELTAKNPTERYATAERFLRDLDQILNRM